MQALMPWLSIAVVIVAGWMLIKRMQSTMTLLFAGLVMILIAIACGVTGFLPKGAKPTGCSFFDIFALLKSISEKQISGTGLLIMVAGGFAGYMDKIGAAKTAGLEPVVYLVQYQLPIAVPVLIICAVAHFFVQRYYDRKNDDVYNEAASIKAVDAPDAPVWYAVFPFLPIVLMIIFSKLVVGSVRLDAISALMMVWICVVVIELIRFRSPKKVFGDAIWFWKKMGGMFTSIVALIICAEFFAAGLKVTGVVKMLIDSSNGLGFGMTGMTTVLTGIVGLVTFLTGSGVGAYSSFAALANDVAGGLGGSAAAFVTPMQFASGMIRAMSPVAGVIIAVSGAAGVSPMAVVRRTWIPMIIGMIATLVINWILFI